MTDDIVERLRSDNCWCHQFEGVCDACEAADEIERCDREIGRLRSLIIEWADAEEAANAVFSGPETVAVDNRLSNAIDNLHDEARRG